MDIVKNGIYRDILESDWPEWQSKGYTEVLASPKEDAPEVLTGAEEVKSAPPKK